MTKPSNHETTIDSRYVLRLIVVKVEGVLVPPPRNWNDPEHPDFSFNPDNLFPNWADELGTSPENLRSQLKQFGRHSPPPVPEELRTFLDRVRNHTPVRVGFLSGGPRGWITALEDSRDLKELRDLSFCYDDYPHGSRQTLLQFLMNRFIAGKGRTLLLGNTLEDELMAQSEKTRFRALTDHPDESQNPEHWDWSVDELHSFLEEHQPTE